MQYFIYAVLIVFLAIIILGALTRKKLYKEVDRLEAWKIQIMNKPITDEIAKIKGLNMSGETEKKFESWRNKWDEIITLSLPNLEEKLFDVEEAANKYRFKRAKTEAQSIANELSAIELSLQEMMDDIHLLLHSEEDNRLQIDEIRSLFSELRIYFSQNKGTLGTTAYAFEQKMREIEQSFQSFETATKEGNYFEAREILLMMKEAINYERWKMDEVPKILVQVETEIPSLLEELAQGMEEMEEEGYILEHFSFKNEIPKLKSRLHKLLPLIEEGNIEAANIPIAEMHNEIEQMYDTLEQEVLAKQYVVTESVALKELVSTVENQFLYLVNEVEIVKLSYRIPEEQLKLHLKLEKQVKELSNKVKVVDDIIVNNKQSFITIKKTIEQINQELEQLQQTVKHCDETLNTLRKDELKAKETLTELKGKIRQGQRLIKKSNIPGLPSALLAKIEEAESSLLFANESMEQIPLVMEEVSSSVEEALESVNDMFKIIQVTIEEALAAERVIQYGNRYRSNYHFIHEELCKAEELFRLYEYQEALQTAYQAIEQVDATVVEKMNTYTLEKV